MQLLIEYKEYSLNNLVLLFEADYVRIASAVQNVQTLSEYCKNHNKKHI